MENLRGRLKTSTTCQALGLSRVDMCLIFFKLQACLVFQRFLQEATLVPGSSCPWRSMLRPNLVSPSTEVLPISNPPQPFWLKHLRSSRSTVRQSDCSSKTRSHVPQQEKDRFRGCGRQAHLYA
eukprot:4624889-Amphidinium_carterae.1